MGETTLAPIDPGATLIDTIGRDPLGTDTNDNSVDFGLIAVGTPGAANN